MHHWTNGPRLDIERLVMLVLKLFLAKTLNFCLDIYNSVLSQNAKTEAAGTFPSSYKSRSYSMPRDCFVSCHQYNCYPTHISRESLNRWLGMNQSMHQNILNFCALGFNFSMNISPNVALVLSLKGPLANERIQNKPERTVCKNV